MIAPDDTPITNEHREEAIRIYCAAARDFNAEGTEENFCTLQWATSYAEDHGVLKMAEAASKLGEYALSKWRAN